MLHRSFQLVLILNCLRSHQEYFPEAKEGRALLSADLQASTINLPLETPRFEVLELEKFDDDQIRQVLAFRAEPETVERIMNNLTLRDLARRPVMTELIIEALPEIEAGKPVDISRVYLYAVRQKMQRDIKAERTFTSAVLDLAVPMLDEQRFQQQLLALIQLTRGKTQTQVGYMGGNLVKLLLEKILIV